jgi:uncharacterized membrane protein YccC
MPWADSFWLRVYEFRPYLRLLQLFLVFMLVLTGFTFLFGRPGSGSYTLAVINVALILVFGAVSSGIYWYSARRRDKK